MELGISAICLSLSNSLFEDKLAKIGLLFLLLRSNKDQYGESSIARKRKWKITLIGA